MFHFGKAYYYNVYGYAENLRTFLNRSDEHTNILCDWEHHNETHFYKIYGCWHEWFG